MKKYIFLFLFGGGIINVNADELYTGVKTDSIDELKAVCEDYVIKGFLGNNVDMYLQLLPKRAKKYESEIRKAFEKKRAKEITKYGSDKFQYLKFNKKISKGVDKNRGFQFVTFRYDYKVENSNQKLDGLCHFQKESDGRWYLGQMP